jgi:hypothetical protein
VLIDAAQLDYMDSIGVGQIVAASNTVTSHGHAFGIIRPQSFARRILEITGTWLPDRRVCGRMTERQTGAGVHAPEMARRGRAAGSWAAFATELIGVEFTTAYVGPIHTRQVGLLETRGC